MRSGAMLLAIPLIVFDGWGGTAAAPSGEEAAVRAVVQAYFDGVIEGSPESLRAAFDCEAQVIGVDDAGHYTRVPFTRWSAGMTRRLENPKAHRNEIAAIDITGNAAMVKTVLRGPGITYVDYLSLLRDGGGEWRIVNRIWDASPR